MEGLTLPGLCGMVGNVLEAFVFRGVFVWEKGRVNSEINDKSVQGAYQILLKYEYNFNINYIRIIQKEVGTWNGSITLNELWHGF